MIERKRTGIHYFGIDDHTSYEVIQYSLNTEKVLYTPIHRVNAKITKNSLHYDLFCIVITRTK